MPTRLLILALLALPAAANAAPSIFGVWLAPDDNARIEFVQCGSALCGKVLSSGQISANPAIRDARNKDLSLRERPLKGLTIATGFTGGPTDWKGGKIYDPKSGNTYSGSIKLVSDDKLRLTGCWIFPACRTDVWTRAH